MNLVSKIFVKLERGLSDTKIFLFFSSAIFLMWGLKCFFVPLTSTDGTWSLSPVFSYLRGEYGWSTFAHEQVGQLFYLKHKYAFVSSFYQVLGVSTTSYFLLGFILTGLTFFFFWYPMRKKSKFLVHLLLIGFLLSNYTYGFRVEMFILFMSSILFFVTNIWALLPWIDGIIWGLFCVVIGTFHPVAGVLFGLLMGIHFFEKRQSLGFIIGVLIGSFSSLFWIGFEPIQMFVESLSKVESDKMDHFDGLHFEYLLKYLLEGNAIATLIFFFLFFQFWKAKRMISFGIIAIMLIFFLLAGRSYYMAYFFPFSMVFIGILEQGEVRYWQKNVIWMSLGYSLVLFLTVPMTILFQRDYGRQVKTVLKATRSWAIQDSLSSRIFVPAPLALEVASKSSARLLYPFYRINHGKNPLKENETILVFEKKQFRWIEKNFSNYNQLEFTPLIKPAHGKRETNIRGLLNSKFSSDSIGLWKVTLKK